MAGVAAERYTVTSVTFRQAARWISEKFLYLCSVNDRQYLLSLISEGEHQQQDFKYKVQDAGKLAHSVSAFANTNGGRLLIGVRDDGHLSGVRSEEEIYMMHQAAYKFCQPEASIKFDTFHAEGRTIVVATVPLSERKPIFAIDEEGHRRAYIRIADENILESPVHLAIWREESNRRGVLMTYDETDRQLMAALGSQPCMTLNQLVRRSRISRQRVITMLARLVRYGLADWQYDGHGFLFSLK